MIARVAAHATARALRRSFGVLPVVVVAGFTTSPPSRPADWHPRPASPEALRATVAIAGQRQSLTATASEVFGDDERGPGDELRLQFEAVSELPEPDRQVIKAMIEGMIVKHETKRLVGRISG